MHKKAPATAPAPGVPTPKQRLGGESSVVPRTSLPSPVDYKATPDTPPPPPRLCRRERTAPALAQPLPPVSQCRCSAAARTACN